MYGLCRRFYGVVKRESFSVTLKTLKSIMKNALSYLIVDYSETENWRIYKLTIKRKYTRYFFIINKHYQSIGSSIVRYNAINY